MFLQHWCNKEKSGTFSFSLQLNKLNEFFKKLTVTPRQASVNANVKVAKPSHLFV